MNLDLGATLSRAWRITWQNKILWIFGILAALMSGGGNVDFSFQGGRPPIGQPDPRVEQFFRRIFGDDVPNVLLAAGVGVGCLGLLFLVVLFVLSIIGRGGLIGGIQLADANGKVSFGEAWRAGTRKFWTVLAIGLIVFVL